MCATTAGDKIFDQIINAKYFNIICVMSTLENMVVGDSRNRLLSINSIFLNPIFFQNKMQVEDIMSFENYGKLIATHEVNNLKRL